MEPIHDPSTDRRGGGWLMEGLLPDHKERRARACARCWPPREDRIDLGILPLCQLCWEAGVQTMGSCDGHTDRSAYIWFWDEAAARRAAEILVAYEPEGPHKLIDTHVGEIWRLCFSPHRIVGAQPRQRRP